MLTLVLGLLAVAGAPDGWAEARAPEPEPDPTVWRTPMRSAEVEPAEPPPSGPVGAVVEAPAAEPPPAAEEAPAPEPTAPEAPAAEEPAAEPPAAELPPAVEATAAEPTVAATSNEEPSAAATPPVEPPAAEAPASDPSAAAPPIAAASPAATPPAAPMLGPRSGRARASAGGLVLELHSDFGFARLVRIEFSDHRRATLSLNDGISFALGWSFLPLADGRLGTRASVGVKVGRLRASNGSAAFTAFPVDLMEALHAGPLRLGAGASVLLAPRVGGSGFLEGERTSFAPAPGGVLDAEWLVSSRGRAGIGVRASWYRFASSTSVRGAPSIGLLLRADLDMRSP